MASKASSGTSIASGSLAIPSLACAIYTRKSSEEGLEQDFNSLHAQREACEAYVLSQKSLGWTPIPTAYDDGGFSGGNVARPALKRLIADIEAGLVKVIVVYKVDRLTRSLADFAKLVELFDAMGVSFVSVTQQFNTTTSMGRLTLNVLLSFAQFEREVTGERIRDKIAASKRKGMWMGGVPPVGYRANGRTLELDEPHASRVQEIYVLYLKLKCIRRLSEEVQAKGWLTPERENKRIGFGGNKAFSRGHLHRILSNPIYAGMVHHKGENHPGQHTAIIATELWTAVQKRLESNRQGQKTQSHAQNPSPLSGKVFDETGRRLIPSHTTKGKKRYRYYVTPADDPGEPIRLPATEIEQLVSTAIVNWASNQKLVLDAVGWGDAQQAAYVLKEAKRLTLSLQKGVNATQTVAAGTSELRSCVSRVEVAPTCVRITLDLIGCGLQKAGEGQGEAIVDVQIERKRSGMAVRLVIGNGGPGNQQQRDPDPGLVALMGKAKTLLKMLTFGGQTIETIAEREELSARYVSRVINVGLLAPDIVQAIERGDHPSELNATRLITAVPFPMDWAQQRKMLGMEATSSFHAGI
ncbi:recombinase family protein [Hydrogenophaga sp. BPS33]|uniref:recombinase family protein n=1 Tax=Hydrogenophaga sp. BPS33 TaxID=2651974 RepID=UPI00131F9855|nr:recombinase family protein [Hydrogenophaga sp. BPS33]QHE84728.1 recombinase family protein [Hydrogenophaga sp. BPS33]